MVPTEALGEALLTLARNAIGERFGLPPKPCGALPALEERGATFVTLTQAGALRGCIGSLEAQRSLADDVQHNALAAAFRDPRFPPLAPDEFERTRVEVSLLTPAEPIAFESEADLLAKLRPGEDGLILEWGHHRATFLPQVWEHLPDRRQFFMELRRKAGLPLDFWERGLGVSRYRALKWKEPEGGQ
jgi:AmmeMemoRadiSam system protein A